MTRPMAALISITGFLAAGLLLYRLGPWDFNLVDEITPMVRLCVGVGALSTWMLLLDHRRAAQWRRQMEHLDAIGHVLWRDEVHRRTGS